MLITGSFVKNGRSMHLLSAYGRKDRSNFWSLDRSTLFSDVNSGHGELQRHPAIAKGIVLRRPLGLQPVHGQENQGVALQARGPDAAR